VWLVFSPDAVQADQIDGHWCYKNHSFSIRGPLIVTPGGTRMRGDYDRHGFAYIVPEGEEGAGDKVLMVQQDHNTIHVWRVSSERGKSEVWHRCDPRTS
jgi:hypothetical protein